MQKRLDIAAGEAKKIGEAIRAARKAVSLRQDELALAAGVSTRVVHQLENGKATSRLDSLIPVLTVLGLRLCVEDDR